MFKKKTWGFFRLSSFEKSFYLNSLPKHFRMQKWIWPLVAVIWLILLSWPIEGVPRLTKFLLYPSSPLQINYAAADLKLSDSPHEHLEIAYDDRGVPHIFAENESAMAFAMGYTHAKDRLFQLEMLRRTVKGRLSEVAGERAIPSDRWWLKFDFEKKSIEALQKMKEEEPDLVNVFESYANGFNYFIEKLSPNEKPLEFHLLGFNPTPMKAYAPVMLIRYMDKVLAYRENDLKFTALKNYLPDSLIDFYYPWQSDYAFPIYPELSTSDSTVVKEGTVTNYISQNDFPNAIMGLGEQNEVGSNNWAVSSKKSTTGNSFLCNDTHLGLDLPGTWYEVHQVVNGRIIHGFSIPGAPFVVSGFTEDIAWGMTNATWDLSDFYALEINDDNQYKLDENWEEMEAREVVVPVKGKEDFKFNYYNTWFGPADTVNGAFLATHWVADNFDFNEMKAFYELTRAKSVNEAYEVLLGFGHPPQNFVLADKQGQIGMVTAGCALMHNKPSRGIILGKHKNQKAKLVHQGRKLFVINPEKGWNQSSNHNQVTDSLAPYLNSIFAPSARGRRISERLSRKNKIDRDYLKNMHGEVIDGEWPLLKDHILKTSPSTVKKYLQNWNGACEEESVAATIYHKYKWNLRDSIAKNLLGDFDFVPPAEHLFYLISTNDTLPGPNGYIAINTLANKVWEITLQELEEDYGNSIEDWTYGKYHKIYFRHLTKIEALSNDPFPAKGSPRSINVSTGLPSTHGPSMRTLIELTPNGPIAETVIAAGQSGQPGHANYIDQIDDWYKVEYFPVKWINTPESETWDMKIEFN